MSEALKLLLDTNFLGVVCHPSKTSPELAWLTSTMQHPPEKIQIMIPEIAAYELRRKLFHFALQAGQNTSKALVRLDALVGALSYIPLDTDTMNLAALLWAQARATGQPTAPTYALDGDVILAAQARRVGGTVVTTNVGHLQRFVPAQRWQDVALPEL